MKIICVDNFDRENKSDRLVASGVNKHEGKIMLDALNDKASDYNPNFYKLVEDDYELYVFEP